MEEANYKTIVAPFVSKLRLGAAIQQPVTLDAEACKKLASVMEDMATKIDIAAELINAMKEL